MTRRRTSTTAAVGALVFVALMRSSALAAPPVAPPPPSAAAAAAAAPSPPARRALRQQQQAPPPTTPAPLPPNPPPPPSADDVPWSWTSWRTWVSLLVTAANAFTAAATGTGGAPILVAVATGLLLFTVADAAAFSAAVLAAGSVPALLHALGSDHPLFPGQRPLIDWRMVALTTPPMLVGVMLGAVANESFPAWLLASAMVALFGGAAADMAWSYARLLRRERERDALLRRLEGHVAHEEEEEAGQEAGEGKEGPGGQQQQRRAPADPAAAAAAPAAAATAAAAADDDDDEAHEKAAAFALGGEGHHHHHHHHHRPPLTPRGTASLELSSASSVRSAAGTLAPAELEADLDRLRLLTREIARGEAQALNPALLGLTLDGELEAAFEEQRRSEVAAAAAAAAVLAAQGPAAAGDDDGERVQGRLSAGGGRRSASIELPQHRGSLELVREEDEGEQEAEQQQQMTTTTTNTTSEPPPGDGRTRGLAAAAAPDAAAAAAAAANFLARRVVAVKRDHDERLARARAARVQRAALDDARYHAAVHGRLRSGRRGSLMGADSRLARLRSAHSASNVFSSSFAASMHFARGGGGGGSGFGAGGGIWGAVGAAGAGPLRGGGGGGEIGPVGRSAGSVVRFVLGSSPSGAISAPSDSREHVPSSIAAASGASVAAATGRGGGAGGAPSPFAAFSAGGGSGPGSRAGGSLLGTAGSGIGPRSAHSDVLAVSPWALMTAAQRHQQHDQEQQQQQPREGEVDDDDGKDDGEDDRTRAGDQGEDPLRDKAATKAKQQKEWRRPFAAVDNDAHADGGRIGGGGGDGNDGRVGAFIVDDESHGAGAGCTPGCARALTVWWASRARAFRAWWDLLPRAEAAVAAAAFVLFASYEALEKGVFLNRVCTGGAIAMRLAFVGLMLAVTATTVAIFFLGSSPDRARRRWRSRRAGGRGGAVDEKEAAPAAAAAAASPPSSSLSPGAQLGRHEAAVSWTPPLVAGAVPLALAIGAVGGAIGASGVVVSSALLLRLGGHPQVVAAGSKVTLFTSVAATTLSLGLAGRLNVPYAAAHGAATLLATPLGQACADALVRRAGRPSLLVAANAARFVAGAAAVAAVALYPSLAALARGDPSAEFTPVCAVVVAAGAR